MKNAPPLEKYEAPLVGGATQNNQERCDCSARSAQEQNDLLLAESLSDERAYEIANEIDEIQRDESRSGSRSVLRETPLARWCQSRRKGTRS
jgi:hypothetical protein